MDGGGKEMLGLTLAQRLFLVLSMICNHHNLRASLLLRDAAILSAQTGRLTAPMLPVPAFSERPT